MANTKTAEPANVADGLPRRKALQSIAGSLAGIAALGAVNASAEKKSTKKTKAKRSNKGQLIGYHTAEQSGSIPTATPTTITVTCPAAKKGQQVYATGGGYESTQAALTMFATSSRVTSDGQGWQVTFVNAAPPQNASASVVCAYYKTK